MNIEQLANEIIEKYKPHTDCAGDSASSSEAWEIRHRHAKDCAILEIQAVIDALHITYGHINTNLRDIDAQEFRSDILYYQSILTHLKTIN